ncbi:PD-(D/E)XK nuclease family protein [Phytomonospora sp. NPDC050363]|uniref:RecB family exonuclease n=1 Tax=Phytomonospora sp. NPDC050363 TaxID=3155642 RepID=UPI0033CBD640
MPSPLPLLPVSLSPSRAADFKTCPLLYRFRSVDRLPEDPSPEMARGTLVHAVLERLYDLSAVDRTAAAAVSMVGPEWERLRGEDERIAGLFVEGEAGLDVWLDSVRDLVEGYFSVEDPTRLEPAERECLVETTLDDGLVLRGYVDRLDVSPAGDIRIVDYKTGRAPAESFEAKALFQLRFYALVLWRTRGVVPRMLRLVYLKDRLVLDHSPDEAELVRFEGSVKALWAAIGEAVASGEFAPKPSRLCGWCAYQDKCPAFGGTPPPMPVAEVAAIPAQGGHPERGDGHSS